MDSSRSKKSRSLVLESKSTRQQTAQRPGPGERRTSAPTGARSRYSTAKPPSESAKDGATTNRSSRSSHQSVSQDSSTRKDATHSSRHEERSRDVRPKGRSVPTASADVQQINLAVLGAQGVGKSTFIQGALDLKKPVTAPVSSSKVSLNGVVYRFQLWELLLDDIDYSNRRQIVWPKYINNLLVPEIDGVLCLYDVTNQDSIAEIPELLQVLAKTAIPCVLTACKSDQPARARQVDPGFNIQISSSFTGVQTSETSSTSPESSKRSILSVLKSILSSSRDSSRQRSILDSHPRAATTFDKSEPSKKASFGKSRGHSPSKDNLSKSRSRPCNSTPQTSSEVLPESNDKEDSSSDEDDSDSEKDGDDEDEEEEEVNQMTAKKPLRLDTSPSPRPQTRPFDPQTPVSAGDQHTRGLMSPFEPGHSDVPQTPDSFNVTAVLRPGTANTADSQAHHTFLHLDEESQDDSSQSDRHPSISEFEQLKINEKVQNEIGFTFAELVKRLLQLPTSKNEAKFVPMFLCLYRAFATPKQLLNAIIIRFNEVENSPAVQLTKVAMQLRYLQVMGEWTAAYPGDFYDFSTRQTAVVFVQRLEKSRSFAPAAKEISNNLEAFIVDDDAVWSFSDTPKMLRTPKLTPQSSTGPGSPNQSAKDARVARAEILPWEYGPDSNDEDSNPENDYSPRNSAPTSATSSLIKNTNASSQSLTNLLQLEQARQKAQRLRPVPRNRLSKIQWHQFMDTPIEDLAKEITRIDWIMYSAIRPRDFVRHVMTPARDRKHNLDDNIGAMVKHFNHLAVFVSGMVLLRDKPKHRAKAVEKFMSLAWKVRQLNNYNSLGAIVAGINGHEIARLGQTRELVPPQIQKDFLRLTILMGLSRGHAAYRLAWENSFSERIPFIPLLRQDLTLAQNGMNTWIEGKDAKRKINWRKFEVMGEVIVMIQNSQQSPYKFGPRDEEIIKLILESKVLEGSEDSADPRGELYERSVQIEPAGPGGEAGKKKFDWFRR